MPISSALNSPETTLVISLIGSAVGVFSPKSLKAGVIGCYYIMIALSLHLIQYGLPAYYLANAVLIVPLIYYVRKSKPGVYMSVTTNIMLLLCLTSCVMAYDSIANPDYSFPALFITIQLMADIILIYVGIASGCGSRTVKRYH